MMIVLPFATASLQNERKFNIDSSLEFATIGEIESIIIPSTELELGTYEISFIAVDHAGNELVISGEELEGLNNMNNNK